MNLNENNLAKVNLKKAEKLFIENKDVDGETRIHLNLAEIFLDEKKCKLVFVMTTQAAFGCCDILAKDRLPKQP